MKPKATRRDKPNPKWLLPCQHHTGPSLKGKEQVGRKPPRENFTCSVPGTAPKKRHLLAELRSFVKWNFEKQKKERKNSFKAGMECVGTERKERERNGQMAWGRPDR